jgi:DNA-binding CsgD family transcriptional regulator
VSAGLSGGCLDGAGAAQRGKRRVIVEPLRVVAGGDEQGGGAVRVDAAALEQIGGVAGEDAVILRVRSLVSPVRCWMRRASNRRVYTTVAATPSPLAVGSGVGQLGAAADQGGFPEQLPVDQLNLVGFRLRRGQVRIETGTPERGVEELLQVGQTVRLVPHDNPSGMPWRSWAADGLRRLGRNDEASGLAGEELALARRWGDPHAIGACLRLLGLIEGGTAGIGRLREALDVLAGSQARLEHARALVDLGAALRRANQRMEARQLLRDGVDLAGRIGALGLARRANEEIAATGARPRKIVQTGLDALTASERRVAQLAADGMTNKEIAQTLFVTIKTVELHLGHAYRKLDISSRTDLDEALPTPTQSPAPPGLAPRP